MFLDKLWYPFSQGKWSKSFIHLPLKEMATFWYPFSQGKEIVDNFT